MEKCTVCGGGAEYIGALGRLRHFRCINCGILFSKEVSSDERQNGDDSQDE